MTRRCRPIRVTPALRHNRHFIYSVSLLSLIPVAHEVVQFTIMTFVLHNITCHLFFITRKRSAVSSGRKMVVCWRAEAMITHSIFGTLRLQKVAAKQQTEGQK